jgi:hypothetical protein
MLADMPGEEAPLDVSGAASGEVDENREALALIEAISGCGGRGVEGERAKAQTESQVPKILHGRASRAWIVILLREVKDRRLPQVEAMAARRNWPLTRPVAKVFSRHLSCFS